jgi:osmotically-inducible protein OsmY
MGWLQRLFGIQGPQSNQQQTPAASRPAATATSSRPEQSIPPERVGLDGEYDESGLAKRVALAFDEDSSIDDVDTIYVAQTGSTVVLKGKAPDQQFLNKMVSVARGVDGAKAVDTSQVTVG